MAEAKQFFKLFSIIRTDDGGTYNCYSETGKCVENDKAYLIRGPCVEERQDYTEEVKT